MSYFYSTNKYWIKFATKLKIIYCQTFKKLLPIAQLYS